jgi:transcriptional regulator with XRE-family HTH domain
MFPMTFAKRLITAREAIGWSQTELGREINAAQSTVATWERGKNEPDLATIRRLGKALNRAPEWLAFDIGGDYGPEMAAVDELDVRAYSGAGGLIDVSEGEEARVVGRYVFPRQSFKNAFGVEAAVTKIFEIIGDSMVGPSAADSLHPGQKVFVNPTDCVPSPPGIFVVWDGLGLVLKRVEYVAHSDPPRVRITSDNPRYQPYERLLDEAYIQGRVIGSWQRR